MRIVHKYGRNAAVGTAWEDIWEAGGTIPWPAAAETLSLVSSGAAAANDDIDAGTGARTVTVQGLDANYAEIDETVEMQGTTPVVTTLAFYRTYRMWVATAGTGGTNAGTIIATGSDSSDEHNRISIDNSLGLGQSQYAAFTIPAGSGPWALHSAIVTVDSGKTATVGFFAKEPGGAARLKLLFDGLKGTHIYHPATGTGSWVAGTDLWWAGYVDTTEAKVSVDFEMIAAQTSNPPALFTRGYG